MDVEVSKTDLKRVYQNRRKESKRKKIKNIRNICIHLFSVKYSYRSLISVSGLRGSTTIENFQVSRRKKEKNWNERFAWPIAFNRFGLFFYFLKREVKRNRERREEKDNTAKRNLNVDNPVFSPPRSKLPFEFRISSFLWLQLSFPFFPPQFLFPLPSFNPPSLFSSVLSFSRVIGNLDLLTWDFPTQFLPDLRDHGSSSTSAHSVRWVQLQPESSTSGILQKDGSSSNKSLCSRWQCDFCLSLMATAGDSLLRRYSGLEIRIWCCVSIRCLVQVCIQVAVSQPDG